MAKVEVSKDMQIDLSLHPAKCDHCTLRKQSKTLVLKKQEGDKDKEQLGRVYVDLCGPMSATSHTGKLYCMNLINNFSSYIWTIPYTTNLKPTMPSKYGIRLSQLKAATNFAPLSPTMVNSFQTLCTTGAQKRASNIVPLLPTHQPTTAMLNIFIEPLLAKVTLCISHVTLPLFFGMNSLPLVHTL